MEPRSVPERYVRLCLQVDAHIEDFVDAYFGPVSLQEEVAAEGPLDPSRLHDEAVALAEETPAVGLENDRIAWLQPQLRGLECVTARLAGEEVGWSDEVERCLGFRPEYVNEERFRESHGRLDAALPGTGDLAARYHAWLDASVVPGDRILGALEAVSAALRRRTTRILELPPGERVEYETVTGEPWQAFNQYMGNLHSRIQMNQDLPRDLVGLLDVVAHEGYPGHHVERACKEQLQYRGKSRLEVCAPIVSAPEVVITEGLATNALEAAVGGEGLGPLLAEAGDLGVRVDPAVAMVVHVESWELFGAGTNVARMLHEDGLSADDAVAYLREWSLDSPERAARTVAFLTDPGIRTYSPAYTFGRRLCRSFLELNPDGFRRLLTEQVTVSSLQGDDSTANPAPRRPAADS
jgi:hypothetical protein